jgi:hypothetical protein
MSSPIIPNRGWNESKKGQILSFTAAGPISQDQFVTFTNPLDLNCMTVVVFTGAIGEVAFGSVYSRGSFVAGDRVDIQVSEFEVKPEGPPLSVPLPAFNAPLNYNGGFNTVSIPQVTTAQDGYLSAADYTTLINQTAQNALTPPSAVKPPTVDAIVTKMGQPTGFATTNANTPEVKLTESQENFPTFWIRAAETVVIPSHIENITTDTLIIDAGGTIQIDGIQTVLDTGVVQNLINPLQTTKAPSQAAVSVALNSIKYFMPEKSTYQNTVANSALVDYPFFTTSLPANSVLSTIARGLDFHLSGIYNNGALAKTYNFYMKVGATKRLIMALAPAGSWADNRAWSLDISLAFQRILGTEEFFADGSFNAKINGANYQSRQESSLPVFTQSNAVAIPIEIGVQLSAWDVGTSMICKQSKMYVNGTVS